jgi:hypothetical protein
VFDVLFEDTDIPLTLVVFRFRITEAKTGCRGVESDEASDSSEEIVVVEAAEEYGCCEVRFKLVIDNPSASFLSNY